MAITATGSSPVQTRSPRATSSADAQPTTPASDPSKVNALSDTQKTNVAQDIVNGARSLFQGVGNALQQQLQGQTDPDKPTEVAGGGVRRPCGRGGKCTASRGLGNNDPQAA